MEENQISIIDRERYQAQVAGLVGIILLYVREYADFHKAEIKFGSDTDACKAIRAREQLTFFLKRDAAGLSESQVRLAASIVGAKYTVQESHPISRALLKEIQELTDEAVALALGRPEKVVPVQQRLRLATPGM